jgi:hypothetical protein
MLMCHAGVFRIGTLHDYRRGEVHEVGIADTGEGQRDIHEIWDNKVETAETQSWISKRFVGLRPGQSILMSGNHAVVRQNAEDAFVYCLSESRERAAITTAKYDAVVEVRDPFKFASLLVRAIQGMRWDIGACRYIGRSEDVRKESGVDIALLKEPSDAYQREWRIVTTAAPGRRIEPFNVHCPAARELCRIVPIL